MVAALVLNSVAIAGSAGRRMNNDKGPITVIAMIRGSRPRNCVGVKVGTLWGTVTSIGKLQSKGPWP
jgi:hypothetical protein